MKINRIERDYGEVFLNEENDVISCHFRNFFNAEYENHKCIHVIWYDKDLTIAFEYKKVNGDILRVR